MATLDVIKSRALLEDQYEFLKEAELRYKKLKQNQVEEIIVPRGKGDLFEDHCDFNNLPCYRVTLDGGYVYFLIAKDYSTLLQYENRRRGTNHES